MLEHPKYAALGNEGAPGFNWSAYEDGWNGTGLKVNNKVRVKKNTKDKVFSHESYAQELYNKICKLPVENAKDIKKGASLTISNLAVVDDNTLVATVGNGANSVLIDLDKEAGFIRLLTADGKHITKEQFAESLKTIPEFKDRIISMDLKAKIGNDTDRGSIWEGYVEQLTEEFKQQITENKKAYWAEILSVNNGGFVVEVASTIRAFMPGSQAANNRIDDYNTLVGKTMEVMIDSWNPRHGFIVSRKKYINTVRHDMIIPIDHDLKKRPDKIYHTRVTGCTPFGVFVEINEFINGMLHKTLVSDELREKMRQGTINPGDEIDVYVHRIDVFRRGDELEERVILSDVPVAERDAVIAKREAEDFREKNEHIAQKRHEAVIARQTTQNDEHKTSMEA